MLSPSGMVTPEPEFGGRPRGAIKAGDYKNQLQSAISSSKVEFTTELDKALTAWQQETDRVTTDDIRKVKTPADFVGWFGSSVGNAVANIPMSLLTFGAESMLAESGLTYLDGIIKKSQELSEKEGKTVTPKDVIERDEDGYAYALAFGTAAGAIDFLGAVAGGTGILQSVGEKPLRKAAQAWALGASGEGVTEPIQNFLNDMGQYYQLGGTNYVEALKQGVAGIPQGLSEGLSAFTGTLALGFPGTASKIGSAESKVNFPVGDLQKPSEITNFVEQKSENAVQEQETAKVDVQVPAKDGEGVGTGNQLQEPAGESTQGVEETQEVAETPQTRLSSAITEFIEKLPADQPITDQPTEELPIPDLQKILKDKGVKSIVSDMGDGRWKINLQDENGEIQSSITVGDTGTDTVAEKKHFAIRTTDSAEVINETINQALEVGGLKQKETQYVTEQPRVFLTKNDIEYKKSFGETFATIKDKGDVVRGEIVEKSNIAEELYHVTTAKTAVANSGLLKHMPSEEKTVGLGKGTSMVHWGVSLTSDIKSAENIERELKRAVELARDNDKNGEQILKRFADEDGKRLGIDLTNAINSTIENYKFHKESGERYAAFQDFKHYLHLRENAGGDENPIVFGFGKDFAKINPDDIGIIKVKSRNIPDSALIRKDPIGFGHLNEVMVHSDIPITPDTPQAETPEVVQPESPTGQVPPTIIPPEETVIPAEEELRSEEH